MENGKSLAVSDFFLFDNYLARHAAVWFAENEIKETLKYAICDKVSKEGYVIEPENQEDVKRLQKRFPFVTDNIVLFLQVKIAYTRISIARHRYLVPKTTKSSNGKVILSGICNLQKSIL